MEGRDPFNFICNKLTTFNVNAGNNRLNSFTENQVTVPTTYDLGGNMLTQGSKNFVYNASGKLSPMNSPGGVYGVYRYDAFGRRVKKSYAYQGQSGMLTGSIISIYGARSELLSDYQDETSGTGTTTTRTNYINDDNNLAIATVTYSSTTGTETTKYLYRNHMNQVIDPYTYTSDSGRDTMYAKPFSSGGNNQFAAHKDDPESGLHFNIERSYSPSLSRWTAPDPIMATPYDPQSLNKYNYNRNDPINLADPDGKSFLGKIFGGIASGLSAIGNAIGGAFTSLWDDVSGSKNNGENPTPSPVSPIQQPIGTDPGPSSSGGTNDNVSVRVYFDDPTLSAPNNAFVQTPVHGLWTYGNWCGAGGSRTPINGTDAACMAHDQCYAQAGLSPLSNFQGDNPQLQACNQNLCNAVSARRQSIINQATTRAAWLSPNGSSRGSSPAYFPGQENEIQADWEINMYFTWVIARGNACQ